ncbi:MAG TPA: asparagine synthetase B family protein [Thermoanaerobaculia bacterium]
MTTLFADARPASGAAERRGSGVAFEAVDGDLALDYARVAIEDGRLVAERDPFGTRPLFITADGRMAASSIGQLLPHVSRDLDDLAIARFLLGGTYVFPRDTVYRDVKRVAPSPFVPRAPSPPRRTVSRFVELFDQAVAKRIPDDKVAVLMSGGLDSTSVAVSARRAGKRVLAYTLAWREHDDEAQFAAAVARDAGLEHRVILRDDYPLFAGWDTLQRDEPYDDAFAAPFLRAFAEASRETNVMLSGHGGDAVLYATRAHFRELLRGGRVLQFVRDFAGYSLRTGALPPLGFRSAFRNPEVPRVPPWIRADLREEFAYEPAGEHPARPDAHRQTFAPVWPLLFEVFHPAQTGYDVNLAAPFFDRHLVEFLFSLPAMPWFGNKYLLRRAMRDRLPRVVARRPKAPMPARNIHAEIARAAPQLLELLDSAPEVDRYVDKAVLSRELHQTQADGSGAFTLLLPFCLAYWFRNRRDGCNQKTT